MLLKRFILTPLLILLVCEASATPTETQEDEAYSLITPAAKLHERQTSGSATCGYIDGDFKTPVICSSGYTCSTYFVAASAGFACCNSQSCPNDFQQCIPSTTYSIASCRFAASKCLYCTGINSECLYYTLYETDTDYQVITGRAFSMSCTDGPSATTVEMWSTATNGPLQTVTCIPSGFSYPTTSTTKCASPAVLLIPIIVSNIMFLAANILLSSFRFQRKLKFWSKSKDVDEPWSPWSGLSTVPLAVIQAIATAALIRAGGYKADWTNLILLWLMRPRMLWAVMFLYSIFGKQYKRSGTDSLFADGILNVLSIPIAAWFIEAYASNTRVCGGWDQSDPLDFGQKDFIEGFTLTPLIYLPFAVVDLFIFVAFVWKRRLGRGWAAGFGFWSGAVFAISWAFWVNWVLYSQGSFCVSNITAIAAIHGIFPFINAALRAWFILILRSFLNAISLRTNSIRQCQIVE